MPEVDTFVLVDGEQISTDDVEFLGIEEGIQGEDILEFRFKGKIYKKAVYRRR